MVEFELTEEEEALCEKRICDMTPTELRRFKEIYERVGNGKFYVVRL